MPAILCGVLKPLDICFTRYLEPDNFTSCILGIFFDNVLIYGRNLLKRIFELLIIKHWQISNNLQELFFKIASMSEEIICTGSHYRDPLYLEMLEKVSTFLFFSIENSQFSAISTNNYLPSKSPKKWSSFNYSKSIQKSSTCNYPKNTERTSLNLLENFYKCAFILDVKFNILKLQEKTSSNNIKTSIKKFGNGDFVINFVEYQSSFFAIFPVFSSNDLFRDLISNGLSIDNHCGHNIDFQEIKASGFISRSCNICQGRLYNQDISIVKKRLFRGDKSTSCSQCGDVLDQDMIICSECKFSACHKCVNENKQYECFNCYFIASRTRSEPSINELSIKSKEKATYEDSAIFYNKPNCQALDYPLLKQKSG